MSLLDARSKPPVAGRWLRELAVGSFDATGRYWPAGTRYEPVSREYAEDGEPIAETVRIDSALVRFDARAVSTLDETHPVTPEMLEYLGKRRPT